MEFIDTLIKRNDILFWFGLANLLAVSFFIMLSFIKPIDFLGTNVWYKPVKFALSTTILVWSVGWYSGYFDSGKDITISTWIIVITLAFEVVYIAWQASNGQASHFNQSTPYHSFMFSIMALAASIATLAIGYIGLKFFINDLPQFEKYYLLAIQLGFILFVIFSFDGFVMGSKLSHTVGAPDGTEGIPFLNWSKTVGDLRVAHFVGMHALQVLPLLAWYILKNYKLTVGVGILYTCLAAFVLIQAFQAKPLIKFIN